MFRWILVAALVILGESGVPVQGLSVSLESPVVQGGAGNENGTDIGFGGVKGQGHPVYCKQLTGVIMSAVRFNDSGLLLSYTEFCIKLDSQGNLLPIPDAFLGADGTPSYPECNETQHIWTNPDLTVNLPLWMGRVTMKMNAKHGSGCVRMLYRYSTGVMNTTSMEEPEKNPERDQSFKWGNLISVY